MFIGIFVQSSIQQLVGKFVHSPSIDNIIREEKLFAFDFMVRVDGAVPHKNISRDIVKSLTATRVATAKYSCFHAF